MTRQDIKAWNGRILGTITTQNNGEQQAQDFYNKILGYYYPSRDATVDAHGVPIAQGNILVSLIHERARELGME